MGGQQFALPLTTIGRRFCRGTVPVHGHGQKRKQILQSPRSQRRNDPGSRIHAPGVTTGSGKH
jgi:hypothetical protein